MKGSCLCKKIQYQIKQLDTPIAHCFCHTCRKAHASAFNTGAGVKTENFEWLQGESELSSYESSPGKLRYFCRHCGSQLLAIKENHPHYVLRVATLDDDPGQVPETCIWTSHQVGWLEYASPIQKFPEWPEKK